MRSPDERIVALLQEARLQLEVERSRRNEPIAIVGIGCRFPGGASSPSEFWRLLGEGFDATSEIPAERWAADAFYDSNPEASGKAYTKRGSFLRESVAEFDAEFFGISPREAVGMDPQQRLLLEVTWEALEDAGIAPEQLRGSATGVWIGLCVDDYARLSGVSADIDAYNTLGNTRSIAAGRISYALDLHGPTVQLDTACSSSLVAIHQACQSLRLRECNLALVGGVNLMLAPEPMIALCKLRALAPDGYCKTFDASADGYGRGEGCGIVVLKRFSDAQAAGDRIYAVVRGSACNHDGHSNGLTAPSGSAQEAVIRAALANGGIDSSSVGYVEAHGTGTLLGDPIEVLALQRVYGQGRSKDSPLYLGAVKTNFGHLEGAAGVAGLIKAALSLHHGLIPRHLHLRQPNPKLHWADLSVKVASEPREWARNGAPRLAGVSSFGISGTNAHVVLEEAPVVVPAPSAPSRAAELVVLSAKTPEALVAAAGRLREHLDAHPELAVGEVAQSLVTTRTLLDHRLTLTVSTRQALLSALDATSSGQTPPGVQRAVAATSRGKLAWLFTGQGAQRLGMGRELYAEWPPFREAFDAATALFDASLDVPLREVMWADPGTAKAALLDQTGYTQPALFALEWALAQLWTVWGVKADILLGHSIGEIAAATVAGVFSLEDAARLVSSRARLMQGLPAGGAMVSLAAPEVQVQEALRPFAATVSLAVVNAPASVVIAGREADVTALSERFGRLGVQGKRLSVSHAFHSPLMDPMLAAFQEVAESIRYHPARTPIVSDTTGTLAGSEIATPQYWVRHVRETVRFAAAVQALSRAGADAFLELGPRPTLVGLVPACLPDLDPALMSSFRPGRSEPEAVLDALGSWAARGGSVAWKGVFPSADCRVPLPTYPWQRRRYWFERREPAIPVPGSIATPLDALYQLQWQSVAVPRPASALTGRWLVLELGVEQQGQALVAALLARGAEARLVQIEDLSEAASGADHVVCVWERAFDGEAAMLTGARGLSILQALGVPSETPRLWWVTRQSVGVTSEDDVAPACATLWGMGRTLMQERPEIQCKLLDVDSALSTIDLILREMVCDDGEDQVAWRSGQRHVARLARVLGLDPILNEPMSSIRTDGTVLVTGGLGALGLAIATNLAERGVERLLLTGRRGLDTPEAAASIDKLQALGAHVSVASADVLDRESLARVLASVPKEYPLRAVVHTAGVVDDALLAEQTPERLARVLGPKVIGAWNLHQLTEKIDLDAFVLFSSVAGTLGSAGQANYAAANAYLDALAAHRRAHGLTALSLAWGPWAGSGMAGALDPKLQARFARQGIGLLSPSRAVTLLHAGLRQPVAHLLAVPIDLQALATARGPSVPAIWRGLLPAVPVAAQSLWLDQLLAQPAARRPEAVIQAVRREVARILSFADADNLPRNKSLKDLGLDSLMAVELRGALSRRVGVSLPATLAFDHPTPEAIAKHILTRIHVPEATESKAAVTTLPSDEPIAIVGIGCRFPGEVNDLDSFWQLLAEGRDAVDEIPRERWDVEALYDPDPDAVGKMSTRQGGFLSQIDRFDASFFGISPREARQLDPQQRVLLETSWEALEDSGICPDRLNGSRTGVFVGLNYHEYGTLLGGLEEFDGYVGTGNAGSVASGRISYVLGLQGPSMTVDTACSSSLVTLHLACQSLRNGECSLALAGGVTLMLTPSTFVEFSRLRGLSPDGRCRTFSAEANGTGWAEGCGMLVLERLSDAKKNGHPVLALVRGSAINQDGRSNGLTAPNGPAQEAVILDALRRAGVSPADVGYVECHGTATTLGDPIEVQALGAALARERPLDRPVLIGSVKSNFGHAQAAAGVAGVIKTVLALQHGRIPRTLHFEHPNPHIAWAELPVQVASEPVDWPRGAIPRFAGVSSFGISGTNAHVVLEEAPLVEPHASAILRSAELMVLSARTPDALSAVAGRLREHLVAHPELAVGDVAFSLASTRTLLDCRLTFPVATRTELCEALGATAAGQTPRGGQRGTMAASAGKLAWLFTGQGAQYVGMGHSLYAEWPVFRAAIEEAFSLLDPFLEHPLRDVMWAEPGSVVSGLLDQTGYTQPALFALEWALAQLWRSWGVQPDIVLGHSIGELVAACVAGVFSLSDAARLVSARARLMQGLLEGGGMVSIAAPESEVTAAITAYGRTVSIAVINAPSSTVIAGVEFDVVAVAERFAARGISTKRLNVSHAFHSPLMNPILDELRAVASSIEYREPTVAMVTNVSGELAGREIQTAEYWVRQVREAVRFSAGVQALEREGARSFVELGPKPILLGLVRDDAVRLPSLREGRSEPTVLLEALGGWVAQGGYVDWQGVFPGGGRQVELPSYPWQRQRHWIETTPRLKPSKSHTADELERLGESGALSAAARTALREILEALEAEQDVDAFYRLNWRELDSPSTAATDGRWLVVALDEASGAENLARELGVNGATVEIVTLDGLARAAAADHVVCVWTAADQAEATLRVASEGLAIVQALAAKGTTRLWWVTQGASRVGSSENLAFGLSVVWGLGRTVMQEHPELNCRLMDVEADAPLANLLAREAAAVDTESQLAWRSGQRYGLRLVRAGVSSSRARLLRKEGTVLVTGGLGSLGLAVALSLARGGVKHLLLTSRQGLSTPGAQEAVASLEALGAQVTVAALDVTSRSALAKVIGSLPRDNPLRGVVHTAGIIDDGMLAMQTPERFARVMGPKIIGAWNLHQLTESADLDLFVLFSSVAGTLGSAGQGAYPAANAFLDGLASYRQGRGLPGLSLAWGPWAGGGMTATLAGPAQTRWFRQGLEMLAPAHGIRLFQAAVGRGESHLVAALLNLPTLASLLADLNPSVWRELLHFEPVLHPIAEALSGMAPSARSAHLKAWAAEQCRAILGLKDGTTLPLDRGFFDLGMDSLMVVELRRRLERGLGQSISSSSLFSHPNIESLVEHLLQRPGANPSDDLPEQSSPGAEVIDTTSPALESDDDVIGFINSRFEADDERTG